MKYSRLGYFIGEGFRNVLKNKKSTGASLMIMCATMIIFGVFLLLGENINHVVKEVKTSQGMQVFLIKDATEEQILELEGKIRELKIDGKNVVNGVVRKTKEDALNTMKERFKGKEDLLAAYEGDNNIFSESYVVTLTELEYSEQVQAEIEKMDNVKTVKNREDTVSTLINLANGIRIVTGAILILLIFISVFIIANTIKLTVHARRKEISIMKYVGATNNFIRWPFIVEGMIIGLIASVISILIIGLAYSAVFNAFETNDFMQKVVKGGLLQFNQLFNYILAVYVGIGIGIGAIGSIISMRKYLKV